MTEEVWDTSTLEQHLTQVGGTLPDHLHDRIIAQGKAIIPALLEILNDENLQMEDKPEGWAPIHAVDLLVEMRAVEAIPSMVNWLVKTEWEAILHSKLVLGLSAFGEAAFESVMAAYKSEDLEADEYLLDVLSELGHKDEELFQAFLGQLRNDVERGAVNLACYGDPHALEPLHKAFDDIELSSEKDPTSTDQTIIELKDAIETLGGKLTAEQERKHEQVMARRKRFGRRNEPFSYSSNVKKPGRNDPCWCGSGKKYKKCHLDVDRAVSN